MPRQQDAHNYRTIAALASYIDRIGAQQRNYRTFVVYESSGKYQKDKHLIKIKDDGTIVAPKDLMPTDIEAAAIKDALKDVIATWPRSIPATNSKDLKKLTEGSLLFEIWNLARTHILWVEERIDEEGTKRTRPWSFYSDGVWRPMRPDGDKLPFYKPKAKTDLPKIMVHEGPKTAAAVERLVRDEKARDAHPWGEELAEYEHWGLMGGAHGAPSADYDELRAANPEMVVYVCDNDYEGKQVLSPFSKLYGGHIKGIMFDKGFPPGWDMADDIPSYMFKGKTKKHYKGPPLNKLMMPATWATAGPKKSLYLRRAFKEEWLHSIKPEVFIHRDFPSLIYDVKEFNNCVRPYSDVASTALLLQKDAVGKGCAIKYDPSKPPGIYGGDVDEGRCVNTHVPSFIKAQPGDDGPWLRFMEMLIPDEQDRLEVMKWCATLIACPDVKMLYGLMLFSETQGVGKTTLCEHILAPLMGPSNVSYPSESDIVDSAFNDWQGHKRLAICREIYSGHSFKAYNKLKAVITDPTSTINKKFLAPYTIKNWVHVIAMSNSPRALKLSDDDRRWLVPRVCEEKMPQEYWDEFYFWLLDENGLNIIKHWAENWVQVNEAVNRSACSPGGSMKRTMIEEGYSPGQMLVASVLDTARNREGANGHDFFLDVDLQNFIKDHLHGGNYSDKLEKPSTIRKVAKGRGWFVSDHNAMVKGWGTRGVKSRMICSTRKLAEMTAKELLDDGLRPLDPHSLVDL